MMRLTLYLFVVLTLLVLNNYSFAHSQVEIIDLIHSSHYKDQIVLMNPYSDCYDDAREWYLNCTANAQTSYDRESCGKTFDQMVENCKKWHL